MKKFSSIILSLVMVLLLLPVTTIGAAKYINEVFVGDVRPPVAGMQPDSQPFVSKDSDYEIDGYAEWYDETDKRFITYQESFKMGHTYTVQVRLVPKEGYEFDATPTSYNMKGTINGKKAELSKDFEYQRWAKVVVSYTFPELKEQKKITRINVSDIIEPKIGRQSIARAHYLKYTEGVTGMDASWHINREYNKEFKGIFEEKTVYTFVVEMEAQEGYEFARKASGACDVLVTFNGYVVSEAFLDGEGNLVARMTYDKLGEAKKRVSGIITYWIKEPVIGEKPSYEAVNQRDDGVYVIDTGHSGSVNGIIWEEGVGGNSRKMTPDDTFKAGEYYHVTIRVKPVEGYLFDTDTNDDFMLVGAINSEEAICGGTDESAFVGLTFDKLEAPETRTVISEIEITSNHEKFCYVGGQNYTPHFEVTKGEPATVSFEYWRQTKGDTVANDFGLGEDATFYELPTTLIICIYFRGAAGKEYVLSKDVSVTINGQKCNTGMFKSGEDYSEIYASTPEFIPLPRAKAPTFTVTFDSMGGSRVKSIKNLRYGEGIEEPEPPERDGYTFKRWCEDEECEVAFIFKDETNANGGYARITDDITLYAKWEKNIVENEEKPEESEKESVTEKEEEKEKSPFSDVAKGEYYYKPVLWAVENGITGGTSATAFSPDTVCTRAQVVTFLHRMVASPEPAAISMPFTDVSEDSYYYKPVKWALGSKITGGTSEETFSPDASCTRAQALTFLWRTCGQPEAENRSNPFNDVSSGSYYYEAVLWAVESGISGGTSEETFSPDAPCTRAQVVTFLYRFIND
ncbi:MAG: S-layer homology domain-containing protein [Clostridia bacterium]|nr:S-layer homology domain-containing protein [Clostridia bacterium]